MSIATQITRIQTAKANLKTAIESKGITVSSATTIDGYPVLVSKIPSDVNSYSKLIDRTITDVDIVSGMTVIRSHAFSHCTALTSVTIADTVTEIGAGGGWAFQWCSSLSSVTIPSSVVTVNSRSFQHCTSLAEITCLATTAPTLGNDVFNDIPSTGVLRVPTGSDYSTWVAQLPSGWTVEYI